eukprot:31315-Pelagococcus_subviridis.AAC.7
MDDASTVTSVAASFDHGSDATVSIHPRVTPYAGACSVIFRSFRSSASAVFKTSAGGACVGEAIGQSNVLPVKR